MKKAKEKGVNLVLAVDAKIADSFSNDANTKFCAVNEIPDGWEGLDIGPKSEEIFAEVIKNSKTILWNGPTGVFEFENFTHGSRTVGEAIVEATKKGAFSLVGGGDSVACVNKFGLASGVFLFHISPFIMRRRQIFHYKWGFPISLRSEEHTSELQSRE